MHQVHTRTVARRRSALALAAAALGALALVAAVHASAAGRGVEVAAAKTTLGRVLVSAQGRTLYMFMHDKRGVSTCYGQCAGFWPPLLATANGRAGGGVKGTLIGTTKRHDGTLQLTYAGHPLYRFAQDTARGQTNGEGIQHFGGRWWAVAPSGAAVRRSASTPPTTTTPTTTTTGGGYGGGYGP
jgi:predicted lipoprotein with Yx(FWY)xxD motif